MEVSSQLHVQGPWPPSCGAVTSHKSNPPYSPNLTLHNFHLFGPLKEQLADKQFATDTGMKQAVTSWLQTLDTTLSLSLFFGGQLQALMPWWDNCLNFSTVCYPIYTAVRVKFLASEHLLPCFETSLCIQPIRQHA